MLTIKQIIENKEAIVRGLEKKHFPNAKEAIEAVLAIDNKRKEAQVQLDELLNRIKTLSKHIGDLMKQGLKEEAEKTKGEVSSLKSKTQTLEETMKQAQEKRTELLYQIPNVPYEEVPEGKDANDNIIVKEGGKMTSIPENPLHHWELAKKYNLIDFDLGVKISGAGFPVYIGQGARLQLLPRRGAQSRLYGDNAANRCQCCFRLRDRSAAG